MQEIFQSHKYRLTAAGIILPLLAFALLRLVPTWDFPAWPTFWYAHLVYFYIMAFVSFMAFVAGLFTYTVSHDPSTARAFFIKLAFVAIAAFSFLNSVNTPQILFLDIGNEPLKWSIRLGNLLSAFLFAAASVRWNERWEKRLGAYRPVFWLASGVFYALFVGIVFLYPNLLSLFNGYDAYSKYALAVATIVLLLLAARRSWELYRQDGRMVEGRLTVALLLLVEAQISQAWGVWGQLSWQLHSFVTLAALMVILSSFLKAFHSLRNLQPARYFAVQGSILIFGLSLASGELARWLTTGVQRRFVVSLTLAQGTVGFIILYMIVLGLNRLIEERTKAFEQEQKLRNELTQLIVHDLKNPLMIMTQGTKLLDRGYLGEVSERQKDLLQRMGQSGEKTLRLIKDLLDVDRFEAGAIELQLGTLDLWKALGSSVANFQILADANQQSLSLRLTTRLPVIEADTKLMRRVIDNVIGNALKFAPENGRIEVSARQEESYVTIDVADSGPGIQPANRALIFEKFSQVPTTERRGAGLGLTFCKMAVEAHGGAITVEDSHLGGALFRIALPIAKRPATDPAGKRQRIDTQLMPHPPVSPLQASQL
ncbi:MAG: HAMP domain-containing histidine kinase [Chloroflexi bacterium]|nr:HAMP domain-containing histidine kinase [Chloroflexota bacterium]